MHRRRDNAMINEQNPDNFQENNDEGVVMPQLDVDVVDYGDEEIDTISLKKLKTSISDRSTNNLFIINLECSIMS